MRSFLLLALLLLTPPHTSASKAATQPITLSVYPRMSASPATIRVRITLPVADAHNRALCLQVDGTEFRSSCWELRGLEAPRTVERWVKDLPAGCYVATGVLGRDDGVTKSVSEEFRVVGFAEETEGC